MLPSGSEAHFSDGAGTSPPSSHKFAQLGCKDVTGLMLRIPILKLGQSTEDRVPLILASYVPSLLLEGLQVGVDNLRHDVHLSPKFGQQARLHI